MKSKLFSLLLVCITLFSCQKELSLESTTGTGGGGGTQTDDCKACQYLPMCNGSVFTYYDTLAGAATLSTDTVRFIKDTSMSGKTFQKFYATGSQSYSYTNCTAGVSRLVGINAQAVGGATIAKVDLVMLKASLAVNGTWSDTVTNPAGQPIIYNSKIISKGNAVTLNGLNFSDVIHVQMEAGADIPLIGFMVLVSSDYYYAKGVGLIEFVGNDPLSGMVIQHRTVKSYFIP